MSILATTIWSSVFMWRSGPVFIYDIVLVRSFSSDRKFWEIQKPNCREITEQINDNLRHFSWKLKIAIIAFFPKILSYYCEWVLQKPFPGHDHRGSFLFLHIYRLSPSLRKFFHITKKSLELSDHRWKLFFID